MTDQAPFRDLESMYAWLRGLAKNYQDVTIEVRGPKGRGKSALILWMIFRINQEIRLADVLKTLVYTHKDFAGAYRHIKAIRDEGDRSPQFFWADDASRLFDRREHMTKKNKAMLNVYRTMRDAVSAIMFLGTQDDLLEGPVKEGGTYVLIDMTKHKFKGVVKWPVVENGKRRMKELFTMRCPNPEKMYPLTWSTYRRERARSTDGLHEELLDELEGKKPKANAAKSDGKQTVKQRIIATNQAHPDWSSSQIARKLGTDPSYVRQVLSTLTKEGV